MINTKKVKHPVNEEELQKIKDLDWGTYFKKYPTEESSQLMSCPECGVILVPRAGEAEITCYNCGKKVTL